MCTFSDVPATKARVFRPEPSPTPTHALYVVTAFEGDDDAEGSSSREFVKIPRNEARADTAQVGGAVRECAARGVTIRDGSRTARRHGCVVGRARGE